MMKNRELKRRLRIESLNFVPNLKEEILQKLNIPVKPKKLYFNFWKIALVFSVFILSLILSFSSFSKTPSTILTIDINPSLEIELNEKEKLLSVRALNLDGAHVLECAPELNGKTLEEALSLLLQVSVELGYLDPENEAAEINILTVNKLQKLEDKMNQKVQEKFEKLFQKNSWKTKVKNRNQDGGLNEKAKKNKTSKGIMMLIEKALKADPNLSFNEALKLSPKELNTIIKDYREDDLKEFQDKYRDIIKKLEEKKREVDKENEQKIEDLKESLNNYLKRLNKNGNMALRVEIKRFLEDQFPDFNFICSGGDLQGRINELLNETDSLKSLLNETVENNYRIQIEYFNQEVKKKIGNKDFKFDCEFQKQVNFDDLIKNYRKGMSFDQKQIYQLTIEINTLIALNKPFLSDSITRLYTQYQNHLVKTDESFQNSLYIQKFEAAYEEFLNR